MNEVNNVRLFFRPASEGQFYDQIEYVYPNGDSNIVIPLDINEIKHNAPKISTGDLDIRESTIPNAGNGTFCERDFDKDEIVSYYSGPIVSGSRAKEYSTTHHKSIVTWGKYVIIGNIMEDGDDHRHELILNPKEALRDKGIGAYINDARDEERYNVEFIILDSLENQEIWVEKILKGREKDPNNRLLVRDLYSMFDAMVNTSLAPNFNVNQRIVIVKALRKLNHGEELFVNYSDQYWARVEESKKKKRNEEEEEENKGRSKKTRLKSCIICGQFTTLVDPFPEELLCSSQCQQCFYYKHPELLKFINTYL